MPVHNHLKPIEIKDFTPGLYTDVDWLMPANGAQQMVNCHAQVGGGLRAFYKATAISTSGIVAPAKERALAVHGRGGVPARSGAPADLTDRYLLTYLFDAAAGAGSKARPRLYRMDGSNAETTWTQIKKPAAAEFAFATNDNNAPSKARFRYFRLSAGAPNDQKVLLQILYVGADSGLYSLNYNDLSAAQIATLQATLVTNATQPCGPLAIHQARVVIFAGNSERMVWSDPGTLSFPAANFLDVDGLQDLPNPVAIATIEPSDLFVMREGAPIVLVQGDITNPTVQSMVQGIVGGGAGQQDLGRTDQGMALITHDGYVYLSNGSSVTKLSQQIRAIPHPADYVGQGSVCFIGEYLFCPGGLVYHFPTQSWFTQTQLAGTVLNVEPYTSQIWGTTGEGVSFSLAQLIPVPATGAARVSSYTWQSSPMRSNDERQLRIREVDIIAKSYDANATITVTVNGTALPTTLTATGRQTVQFLFNERAEVLDVTVTSTAGSGANEAPSIEAVRIWTQDGHDTL